MDSKARFLAHRVNRIRARGEPLIWGVYDTAHTEWFARPDSSSPTGVRRVEFADRADADALAATLNGIALADG